VNKTWFITGTSKGFGRVWAEAALGRGDRVVATARQLTALRPLVDRYGDLVLPVQLDVTDRAAVFAAIQRGAAHFGGIEVFVNNAGYGSFGTVEEITEAQCRAQLETNFFGALSGIQAVLPILREQGHGHIVMVSSQLGQVSMPWGGLYAASKWALEGLTTALAAEVGPFGISVSLVEPAGYSTGFYSADAMVVAPEMSAYAPLHEQLQQVMATIEWGDPQATASAILALADAEKPPLRLLLGRGPYEWITGDFAARTADYDAWRQVSEAAFAG
jgi:NAD(P)-dependent dehydrogenase (short-subunit alcohol dehydrogenase family)